MILPYRTYGINLSKKSDDNSLTISMDGSGNLVFKDEYVINILEKPNGITLKELYTRVNGIYSNSNGELFFKDSTTNRPYGLKEIVDSCKNWKSNLLSGALWWMNRLEFDHHSCANLPRKNDLLGASWYWSIDKFFYEKLKTNAYSKCGSDEILAGDLFVNKLNGEWLWYDVPGLEIVLPPITDTYKVAQIISKLAYVTYNSSEPVVFRLWDATNNIELNRVSVIQCNPCEVSYPVVLSWQGQLDNSANCTLRESCGCITSDCATGDPVCDTPDSVQIIKKQYALGSRVIRIQFHTKNYQVDQWTRLFGMEIDGTYLTKSTIEALIFDTNTQGKYGKKHGSVVLSKQNSYQVTFDQPLDSSNYAISLSCNKNINCWWENKTINGFKIVSELSFSGTIDWMTINLDAAQ